MQRGAIFATVTFTRPVLFRPEAESTAAMVTRKVAGPREYVSERSYRSAPPATRPTERSPVSALMEKGAAPSGEGEMETILYCCVPAV